MLFRFCLKFTRLMAVFEQREHCYFHTFPRCLARCFPHPSSHYHHRGNRDRSRTAIKLIGRAKVTNHFDEVEQSLDRYFQGKRICREIDENERSPSPSSAFSSYIFVSSRESSFRFSNRSLANRLPFNRGEIDIGFPAIHRTRYVNLISPGLTTCNQRRRNCG